MNVQRIACIMLLITLIFVFHVVDDIHLGEKLKCLSAFYVVDNLALNKPTWQSSTYSNYSSDRAVDGKMNLRMALGGQCAISDGDFQEVKWMVDLGEVYAIHSIFIYFRIEHSSIGKNKCTGYMKIYL